MSKALQNSGVTYFYGSINNGGALSNVILSFDTWEYSGVTPEAGNKIRIVSPGVYYMMAQKLVQLDGTNPATLYLRVNGTMINEGYFQRAATNHIDLRASCIKYLNANDYIDFYMGGACAQSWGGVHSVINVFKIE